MSLLKRNGQDVEIYDGLTIQERHLWVSRVLDRTTPPLDQLETYFVDVAGYRPSVLLRILEPYMTRAGEKYDISYACLSEPIIANIAQIGHQVLINMFKMLVVLAKGPKAQFRIPWLKNWSQTMTLNEIGAEHVGSLVKISGALRKMSPSAPMLTYGVFICRKCGSRIEVPQILTNFSKPLCRRKCAQKWVTLDQTESTHKEAPIFEFQELHEKLNQGETTKRLKAYSFDNDKLIPGSTYFLFGIVERIINVNGLSELWFQILDFEGRITTMKELSKELVREAELVLAQENCWQRLVNSVAPSLFGLKRVKESILLQLVGGQHLDCGFRPDIHILLMGDPGMAKSRLLTFAAKISGGIFTMGAGSTAAGLTAAAVKETDNRWSVQAGAFVLSDGRFLAIDELDKMRASEVGAIHEAMEQQTVTVAKAGLVMTLNARTPVLAAANPKAGRFNKNESIESQILFPVTLLSRFDLIFPLFDTRDDALDKRLAEHLLTPLDSYVQMPIREQLLSCIIRLANKIRPSLSERVRTLLAKYYVELRSKFINNVITVRQLQALIRLAVAKAKLRLDTLVKEQDVKYAKTLLCETMTQAAKARLDGELVNLGVGAATRTAIEAITDILRTHVMLSQQDLFARLPPSLSNRSAAIEFMRKRRMLYAPKPGLVALMQEGGSLE